MIHEQNSIVGVANKAVADKMDAIVICYEKCFEEFEREKTRLLGNPRAVSYTHLDVYKRQFVLLKQIFLL